MSEAQEAKQTDEFKQKGEQAVEQAREKAQEGANQAKGTLRQELDKRSNEAAEQIGSTAEAMRKVSEELRKQDKQQPAKLMTQAAEKAERVGRYLRESDGERMLSDFEGLVRKKPWAAVAGGTAVGLAFSRFLKASSSRRQQSSGGQQQAPPQGQIKPPAEPMVAEWEAPAVVLPPEPPPQPAPVAHPSPMPRT